MKCPINKAFMSGLVMLVFPGLTSAARAEELADLKTPAITTFPHDFQEGAISFVEMEPLNLANPLESDYETAIPWQFVETPDAAGITFNFSNLAQATAPSADEDPWRVEFRPYLQVPFAVDGRLVFESAVDIGSNAINTVGGNLSTNPLSTNTFSANTIGNDTIGDGDGNLEVDLGLGLDISSIFLLGGEMEVWYNDFGLLL
jgi:hypothetical protein